MGFIMLDATSIKGTDQIVAPGEVMVTIGAPFDASPESLSAIADTTLAYVNTARAVLGRDRLDALPPGMRADRVDCVLARALGAQDVTPGEVVFATIDQAQAVAAAWVTTSGGRTVATPSALVEFVLRFDAGLYPELIEA